jgi:creatinine amidohydrolase
MLGKHRLRELTWHDVNEAARANKVILLPIGCIEQHGPHLPLDVDNLIVEHLAEESARRRPDLLLVAPAIHYGFNVHNQGYPGCLNANIESILAYLYDVAHSMTVSGFRKVVLVNGHGSNADVCRLAARKVVNATDSHCAAVSWWDLVADYLREHRDSVFPGGIAHACEAETSLCLHIRPEGVDMSKAVADVQPRKMRHFWVDLAGSGPVAFTDDWSRLSRTGVEGDPTTATAEKGRRIAELVIARLMEFCEDFQKYPIQPRRDFTIGGTPPT